jgi:hypothetical protein
VADDIVRFPQGLKCTWTVSERIRKHYKFGPTGPAASPPPPGDSGAGNRPAH